MKKPMSSGWQTGDSRVAVVLAGGQSRRFGGNKLAYPWQGSTLLERVTESLHQTDFEVYLSVAHANQIVCYRGHILLDPLPGEGPLQALTGALDQLDATRLLLVAGDMPFVLSGVFQQLWRSGEGADLCFLEYQGKPSPLPGVYSKALLPAARELIRSGKRDLKSLIRTTPKKIIIPEDQWRRWDPEGVSLSNINTLGDLECVTK